MEAAFAGAGELLSLALLIGLSPWAGSAAEGAERASPSMDLDLLPNVMVLDLTFLSSIPCPFAAAQVDKTDVHC